MDILKNISSLLEMASQISPTLYSKIQNNKRLSSKEFAAAGDADLIPGGSNIPPAVRQKMLSNYNKGRR